MVFPSSRAEFARHFRSVKNRLGSIGCPKCGANLAEGRFIGAVIATGRCRTCLTPLWNEPALASRRGDSSADPSVGRHAQELTWRNQIDWDQRISDIDWWILARYLLIGVAASGTLFLLRSVLRDAWQAGFGASTMPLLDPLLMAPAVAIIPWGLVATCRKLERQAIKLDCWNCGSLLRADFLLQSTGCCQHCGVRVLADPLPGLQTERSERPVALADLCQSRARFDRVAGWPCLFGSLPAFACLAVGTTLSKQNTGAPADWESVGLMLLAFPVQFAGIAAAFYWLSPRLPCPDCKTDLVSRAHIAIATRNCPQCGHEVIASRVADDSSLTQQ